MSIVCPVQERHVQMPGHVTDILTSRTSGHSEVKLILSDTDGSPIRGAIYIDPEQSMDGFKVHEQRDWTVVLKAQVNLIGDVAICVTDVLIDDVSYKLR